ncbi:hypothetical protein H6G76_35140 [Nostoc sp. FACHB-152]|uniref:hypothetical protein n=1 Tax=Nostoc sp. FACHB-152 TaxID=2692837 RepID=UPI0016861607|nr:hypothetical protein [Nostoc sp. FACHB-152]MBD2452247.1 hypothetical protein [Nostoc sp. FACHB-152]
MSSNNQVVVTISARDEASRVISGLQNSIEGATLRANLLATALTSGISSAFSALNSKFKESAQLQLNNITGASTYAALTGRTFSDAEQVISKINDRLAEAAASLPGNTQAYKDIALGIQDNLIPAFVDANGVFNEGAFLEGLEDITKGLGVLGAASDVASKDVSKFTAKFLGGSSLSQLQQLLFAEANPAFLALVEKKLAVSGKKLEQLTVKERAEILKAVQAQLVTPDTINAASNSVGGLIESLKSNLFEPSKGLFGLMRDLDKNTKGEQSVLNALNQGLAALIGPEGLLTSLGVTMSLLGITFGDPMELLRNGILFFTDKVKQLNSILTDFNNTGDVEVLKAKVSGFFAKLLDVDLAPLAQSAGKGLAELVNGAFDFLKGLDYGFIAGKLSGYIGDFFQGIGSFLANLDSGVYATLAAGILINVGVVPALTTFAGGLLATFVAGTAGLPVILAVAAGLAIAALAKAIIDNWEQISSLVSDYFGQIGRAFTSGFDLIKSIVTFDIDGIKKSAQDLVDAVKRIIADPLKIIGEALTGNSIDATNTKVRNDSWDNLKAQYDAGEITKEEFLKRSKQTLNGFNGYNNSSIMQAVAKEQKQAPSGSGIVIANTSEAILNQQQQSQLMSALGNKGSLNVGNITIVTQATNAQEIAQDVMKYIVYEYQKFSQGYINTPVI